MLRRKDDFITTVEVKDFKEDGLRSHDVSVVVKRSKTDTPKPSASFYKKRETKKTAQVEVFAQEVMRALWEAQPKTRLLARRYVLSKAVEGFQSFHMLKFPEVKKRILDRTITGFGQVLVFALLVNELDLKQENIGINAKGQVVKIDGDLCFSDAVNAMNVAGPIVASDLIRLPTIRRYAPYNWIGIVNYDSKKGLITRDEDALLGDVSLQESPIVRREVYQGILRCLLLSYHAIDKISELWVSDEDLKTQLCDAWAERRSQLKNAAFENGYFIEYLIGEDSDRDASAYINYLKDFTVISKEKLMDEADIIQYWQTFNRLKMLAQSEYQGRLTDYTEQLLVLGVEFAVKQTPEDFQKTIEKFNALGLREAYRVLNALVVYGYKHDFIAESKKLVAAFFVNPQSILPEIEKAMTAYALLDILDRQVLRDIRQRTTFKTALSSPIDRSGLGVQNPLIQAVAEQKIKDLKTCLDFGWDVNGRVRYSNKTPIFYPAANKHEYFYEVDNERVALIDLLICEGADLHLEDSEGHKALDDLAIKEQDVLDYLMGRQLTFSPDWTPLYSGNARALLKLAKQRNDARLKQQPVITCPPTITSMVQFSAPKKEGIEQVEGRQEPTKKPKIVP